MGSPASFTFTPDYIASLPHTGPKYYLVKPGVEVAYTSPEGHRWLHCSLCRYPTHCCTCLPYPPPAPFPFKDTDYGKASSSWKATQEAINKAERKEKKARKARKFERAHTLCLSCDNAPCCCKEIDDAAFEFLDDNKDSRPEKEVKKDLIQVDEVYCGICKAFGCLVEHDWSDHLLAPDLGGVQEMQDIEPEGKKAKATPASIKKLRRATTDFIHKQEMQELEDDEGLKGEAPKTLKTDCIVCNKTTEYNPEYQTPDKTTCSPECFLVDYAKNQSKLVDLLSACAKAGLAPDWWKTNLNALLK